MEIALLISMMMISTSAWSHQNQTFLQNNSYEQYFVKPSQTILNANVKLKKIPGFEFKVDSTHLGTNLSQSQKHDLRMGYNIKSPLGTINLSANNTKVPGFYDSKKSLSAAYIFKNENSSFSLRYENNNHLDPKTNRLGDPSIIVSGSFIL